MKKKTYLIYVQGKKIGNWGNRLEINISINVFLTKKLLFIKKKKKKKLIIEFS